MKGLFSKLIVITVIGLNVWFTNRVLDLLSTGVAEPAVLIGTWFAFTGGELWALSSIKKRKLKNQDDKKDLGVKND